MNAYQKRQNYLVIGSGVAGLIFALEVAEHGTVTVLCKDEPSEGSTRYAQGGIASVTSPLDSFDSHINDTLIAGDGLCCQSVVEQVIKGGPDRVKDLIDLGTEFDKNPSSEDYSLGKEGGHSARRILHASDATGAEIQRAIFTKANAHPNIQILSHYIAIDLILDEDEVLGAYAMDNRNQAIYSFSADITMLASGGAGKVYLYTSNPDVATGDGVAMAYRAGAKISNMEFIQFHPTCLYHPQVRSFLITEAMRGEGAILRTSSGYAFMKDYDERAELAPRDIVARAIDDKMKKTGDDCVYLDISHRTSSFIQDRFPNIHKRTTELGFNLTEEPIPVVPAAHYSCGGISVDINGATELKRLYASGEVACTGLHGANRLASNSLLEALVISHNAAKHALECMKELSNVGDVPSWDYLDTTADSEEVIVSHSWDEIRRTMWNLVGIVRSDKRLKLAKKRIASIKNEIKDYYWSSRVTKDLIELRNIIDVAQLIVYSALNRKESRGLHYNSNYPNKITDTPLNSTYTIGDILSEES